MGEAVNGGYIIEKGLYEGEEIAVKGTFFIDASSQLSGKPSMINRPTKNNTRDIVKDSILVKVLK